VQLLADAQPVRYLVPDAVHQAALAVPAAAAAAAIIAHVLVCSRSQPVRYLVPDVVIAYIKQHGLYQQQQQQQY
jgi:hypothetical protein